MQALPAQLAALVAPERGSDVDGPEVAPEVLAVERLADSANNKRVPPATIIRVEAFIAQQLPTGT
jgi:hypothetical protein